MVRKLFILVCGLILFVVGWCFGQQSARWNGTSWKDLKPFERTLYLMGFNRGHVAGMKEGLNQALAVISAGRPAFRGRTRKKEK